MRLGPSAAPGKEAMTLRAQHRQLRLSYEAALAAPGSLCAVLSSLRPHLLSPPRGVSLHYVCRPTTATGSDWRSGAASWQDTSAHHGSADRHVKDARCIESSATQRRLPKAAAQASTGGIEVTEYDARACAERAVEREAQEISYRAQARRSLPRAWS